MITGHNGPQPSSSSQLVATSPGRCKPDGHRRRGAIETFSRLVSCRFVENVLRSTRTRVRVVYAILARQELDKSRHSKADQRAAEFGRGTPPWYSGRHGQRRHGASRSRTSGSDPAGQQNAGGVEQRLPRRIANQTIADVSIEQRRRAGPWHDSKLDDHAILYGRLTHGPLIFCSVNRCGDFLSHYLPFTDAL